MTPDDVDRACSAIRAGIDPLATIRDRDEARRSLSALRAELARRSGQQVVVHPPPAEMTRR